MRLGSRWQIFLLSSFLFIYCVNNLSGANEKTAPMKPIDLIPNIKKLKKWSEIGQLELYIGRELIDYINGGAELYFAYNFKEVCIKKYSNGLGSTLTVEIYEMDNSENAYGIYSFDTDGDHPDVGHEATYAHGLLKCWKDRFFIRVYSASEDKNIKNEVFDFAKKIAQKIKNKGTKPEILLKIPTNYIISGSLHYFHKNICLNNFYYLSDENVLNLNDETEAITYEYEMGEQLLRVILIEYPKVGYAKDAYLNFIRSYFFDRSIRGFELLKSSEFIGKVEEEKYTGIKLSENFLIIVFEADHEDSCKQLLNLQAEKL